MLGMALKYSCEQWTGLLSSNMVMSTYIETCILLRSISFHLTMYFTVEEEISVVKMIGLGYIIHDFHLGNKKRDIAKSLL